MASLYGGVEGGATHTVVVILDGAGKVVAREEGPSSNGWLLGIPVVADLLVSLISKAKAAAGVPPSSALGAVGMCMSGFHQPRVQAELREAITQRDPHLAATYFIENDGPGSIYTAAGDAGGMVVIAGTGTMTQLMTADGATHDCGGWGHMFGDEGSAYWIAAAVIRGIFRADHGFVPRAGGAVPDVAAARAAMLAHFGIEKPDGMLDVFYKHFDKARVASFAKPLAELASGGDAFVAAVFARAGRHLGSAVRALAPRYLAPAAAVPGARVRGLSIVAEGSVWKSWPLLRDAFVAAATADFTAPGAPAGGRLEAFTLVRLQETAAVGAAWRGALSAGVRVPVDFAGNCKVLYQHGA